MARDSFGQTDGAIQDKENYKITESKEVKIIDYRPEFRSVFRKLNEQWISTYFELEEADYKAFENTDQIIQNGGYIFVGLYEGEPVGVCALIKKENEDYDFEFAKMAVEPKVQGNNIGFLLGQAAILRAKEVGATRLYLEGNTILKPSINLYRKLGFEEIIGHSTPYKRCNIQMILDL